MIQPNLFFFVPDLNANPQLYAPFFTVCTPPSKEFYTNGCTALKIEQGIKIEEVAQDQVKAPQDPIQEPAPQKKRLKNKSVKTNNQDYSPKQEAKKGKNKTLYEKDKERNILPNAISKLFFFLKSKSKSEQLVTKILQKSSNLCSFLTTKKYYMIHSFIKSKMERYKTEKSIEVLYALVDPSCSIFSISEQLSFIKINAIMLRVYIRNHMYLESLLNNKNNETDKIKTYMKKYRRIQELGQELAQKVREELNFTILEPVKFESDDF